MVGHVRCRYCGLVYTTQPQATGGRCPRCMLRHRRSVTMEELAVRFLRESSERMRPNSSPQ